MIFAATPVGFSAKESLLELLAVDGAGDSLPATLRSGVEAAEGSALIAGKQTRMNYRRISFKLLKKKKKNDSLTLGTLGVSPRSWRSFRLIVGRGLLYGRQLLEFRVARAEEDVALVLEQSVHARVHQFVILETSQMEAGEGRPRHRVYITGGQSH